MSLARYREQFVQLLNFMKVFKMFDSIVMFSMLVVACAFISNEGFALLHAVRYARKLQGSLLQRARHGLARYQWASPCFHEVFMDRIGQPPAYRMSTALFAWGGAMAVGVLAVYAAGVQGSVSALVPMGAAMAVSASFFVGAHGRAFMAQRTFILNSIQSGIWASPA